jgi:predicted nucleotidyltransferase
VNKIRVDEFLTQFTAWASAQPNILGAALVGSYARGTAKETSDVDLVVLARQPEPYLQTTDWTHQFGQIQRNQTEDYGRLISLRVWYADGLEVEFGLTDESWAAVPLDEGSRRVIADGMRVLFERGPLFSRHLPMP